MVLDAEYKIQSCHSYGSRNPFLLTTYFVRLTVNMPPAFCFSAQNLLPS